MCACVCVCKVFGAQEGKKKNPQHVCFGKLGIHHPSPHGVSSKERERRDERRAEIGKYRSEISDNKAISHMVSCEMVEEF